VLAVHQVGPQIEFKLVVARLHVLAQLIERLVVLRFAQVRQLMYHDHVQKVFRHLPKQRSNADFAPGTEPISLDAGRADMQAERMAKHMQFVVEQHLVQRRRAAQIARLEIRHVVEQSFVAAYPVHFGVFAQQHTGQRLAFAGQQLPNLALQ